MVFLIVGRLTNWYGAGLNRRLERLAAAATDA
jgi:hypothetical protein